MLSTKPFQLCLYLAILLLFIIEVVNSAYCSSQTSSSSCAAQSHCTWDSSTSTCGCGLTFKQDIIFVVDGTSYLTNSDFAQVKQFLNNTVTHAMPAFGTSGTRVGLYQYTIGPTPSPPFIVYQRLNTSTTRAQTLLNIAGMTTKRNDSSKTDAYNVLLAANKAFNAHSTNNQRRIMVIITGGLSSFEVCQYNPRDSDIFTYVLTIGSSWNTEKYECLVGRRDEGDSFIELSSASSLLLSTTLNKIEDLSCPVNPVVKITEVKPLSSSGSRFVELKNYGRNISLSSASLTLVGFWEDAIVTSRTWPQGQVLVIFNGDDGEITRMCTSALFIGCCASACSLSSNVITVTTCGNYIAPGHANWTLEVQIGGSVIDGASYARPYWPVTTSGYSYELVRPLYSPAWGSSWAMSCTASGTPGCMYNGCKCTGDSTCRLIDNTVTCNTGTGVCGCKAGYYPNGQTCDKFPMISSCVALVKSASSVDYSWPLAKWDRTHVYKIRYCAGAPAVCGNAITAYGVFKTQTGVSYSTKPGWIGLTWANSTSAFQANYTNCSLATLAPTKQPTTPPTYATPSILSCNYTLRQDRKQYVAKWSYPSGGDISALGDPTGYRLYQNGEDKGTTTFLNSTETSTQAVDVSTAIIVVNAYWSGSTTYVTANKTCTGFTQAPTQSPTDQPTKQPTKAPTDNPTRNPTRSPTYAALSLSYCKVEYLSGYAKTANIRYSPLNFNPPQTVTANVTTLQLSFYCNGTILDTWPASLSQPVRRNLNEMYNFANQVACLRPRWIEKGSKIVVGQFVECNVTTMSPTKAPTDNPTKSPTSSPSMSPTRTPSTSPTNSPTPSPTYKKTNLTECRFDLVSGNQDGIAYFYTLEVDYPNTPTAENIKYQLQIKSNNVTSFTRPSGNPLSQSSLSCINDTETAPCLVMHDISPGLSVPFNFATGSVHLVVTFVDPYDTNGSVVFREKCEVRSAAPTQSPTEVPSKSPTPAPTYGPVHLYLSIPMCDNSSIPSSYYREGERCGCDEWDIDCGLPVPVIVKTEQDKGITTAISVQRDEASYIYDLEIVYQLSFVTKEVADAGGFNVSLAKYNQIFFGADSNKSLTVDIPPDSWFTPEHLANPASGETGPSRLDIGTWNGTIVLPGGNTRAGDIALEIFKEFPPQGLLIYSTDLPNEVFLLTVMSCKAIFSNESDESQPNDIINCTLGYPTSVFLIVQDADERKIESSLTKPNNNYRSWLWYVLAGIAAFLAVVGFMAYRWWVNNKMKQAEVKQADEDIDAVIQEQEEGFGKDLDQVAVNPLAQPFTHLQGPTTKDFNTDDNDAEDGMAEKAEVRTEKIKFKQEFGPTQANKKN